jgi:hypothetical protein
MSRNGTHAFIRIIIIYCVPPLFLVQYQPGRSVESNWHGCDGNTQLQCYGPVGIPAGDGSAKSGDHRSQLRSGRRWMKLNEQNVVGNHSLILYQ